MRIPRILSAECPMRRVEGSGPFNLLTRPKQPSRRREFCHRGVAVAFFKDPRGWGLWLGAEGGPHSQSPSYA